MEIITSSSIINYSTLIPQILNKTFFVYKYAIYNSIEHPQPFSLRQNLCFERTSRKFMLHTFQYNNINVFRIDLRVRMAVETWIIDPFCLDYFYPKHNAPPILSRGAAAATIFHLTPT